MKRHDRHPMISLTLVLALLVLAIPAAAAGNEATTLDDPTLDALVASETAPDRDRVTLRAFLDEERTREVAASQGIEIDRARDVLETLDDEDVQRIADSLENLQDDLVGGDRIVIGSSALIIILLVLLIVAAD